MKGPTTRGASRRGSEQPTPAPVVDNPRPDPVSVVIYHIAVGASFDARIVLVIDRSNAVARQRLSLKLYLLVGDGSSSQWKSWLKRVSRRRLKFAKSAEIGERCVVAQRSLSICSVTDVMYHSLLKQAVKLVVLPAPLPVKTSIQAGKTITSSNHLLPSDPRQ